MATRDVSRKVLLSSDAPGDARKVRAILAGWGVEESSIRRLMREHGEEATRDREARDTRSASHGPQRTQTPVRSSARTT